MIEASATVQNAHGIHCRPTAVIIKEMAGFDGDISIVTENGTCDCRSAMQLIALGLQQGAKVRIRVSGPDEQRWASTLVGLFERHFDFPPRVEGDRFHMETQDLTAIVRPQAPSS